jgi:hypothetical protein
MNLALWESGKPHVIPILSAASVSNGTVGRHRHCLCGAAFEEVPKAKRKAALRQLE